MPLPQHGAGGGGGGGGVTSVVQVDEQPSPFAVLPSSHCSPLSTTPLPHTGDSVWTRTLKLSVFEWLCMTSPCEPISPTGVIQALYSPPLFGVSAYGMSCTVIAPRLAW